MPIEIKIKPVKVGNSLRMTIPKEVSEYLNVKEGDTLLVSVSDHVMLVKKKS